MPGNREWYSMDTLEMSGRRAMFRMLPGLLLFLLIGCSDAPRVVPAWIEYDITDRRPNLRQPPGERTTTNVVTMGGEFALAVHGDEVTYERRRMPWSPRKEYPVAHGVLVGIDDGEFSEGGLFFKRRSGGKDSTKLIHGDVHFIVPLHGTIYILEGLAHGSSWGTLHEVDTMGGVIRPRKVYDLADAPTAYCIHNDSLFIAAHRSLFVVTKRTVELLIPNVFGRYGDTRSMVVTERGMIYAGVREGILRIDLGLGRIYLIQPWRAYLRGSIPTS